MKHVSHLLLLVLIFGCYTSFEANSQEKPNIVMLISDDHGAGHIGAAGHPDVRTQNLDRMVEQGKRFTSAFAADTLCSPSRAVLHTGLMPFRNGGHVFGGQVNDGVKTMSHFLRPLGYQTVLIGKDSLHPAGAFPYDIKKTQWSTGTKEVTSLPAKVEEFLSRRNSDKPLYLEVGTANPHMPWIENKQYDLSELTVPDHFVYTKQTRDALADYYTSVNTLDRTIGKIRSLLNQHGFDENTVFIYTSDHGANFHLAKWCLYDAGIQVPFIVEWPGKVEPGSETDAMISLVDVLPTFVDIAGGNPPENLDGRSFLDVLTGESDQHRQYVFASHTGMGRNYPGWKANHSPHRAVRTQRFKYILNLNPNEKFITHLSECGPDRQPQATHPYWASWEQLASDEEGKTAEKAQRIITRYHWRPVEELYDVRKDPHEQNNLASDPEYRDVLRKLRKRLGKWRSEQGDNVPVHINKTYEAPTR